MPDFQNFPLSVWAFYCCIIHGKQSSIPFPTMKSAEVSAATAKFTYTEHTLMLESPYWARVSPQPCKTEIGSNLTPVWLFLTQWGHTNFYNWFSWQCFCAFNLTCIYLLFLNCIFFFYSLKAVNSTQKMSTALLFVLSIPLFKHTKQLNIKLLYNRECFRWKTDACS